MNSELNLPPVLLKLKSQKRSHVKDQCLVDQMPYANFLEVKKLDSQACNIYVMLATFRPFFL